MMVEKIIMTSLTYIAYSFNTGIQSKPQDAFTFPPVLSQFQPTKLARSSSCDCTYLYACMYSLQVMINS